MVRVIEADAERLHRHGDRPLECAVIENGRVARAFLVETRGDAQECRPGRKHCGRVGGHGATTRLFGVDDPIAGHGLSGPA